MKSKILILIAVLLCVAGGTIVAGRSGLPDAKLTVKVVDENGAPLSYAQVTFTFMDSGTRQGVPLTGLTDAKGEFTGQGGSDSTVGGSVRKEGFYRSGYAFVPFREVDQLRNHWLPWNSSYLATLRKIEHPVPMYARQLRWLEIPVLDQPCGFDLAISDWVAPQGNGKVADLVMTFSRRYKDRDDFDVEAKLSFSNQGDGIQEVTLPEAWRYGEFVWPRMAPEDGYRSSFSAQFGTSPARAFHGTATDKQAYFFRVRTVEQNGKIVSALYGKIRGGIGVDARDTKTGAIYFTYYLNPTSLDRNMEWDTTQNLIEGVREAETPRKP